ncbi:hypothetical protein RI065_04440 [Mycoplasmatota bacterium zrk1]
MIIDSIISVSMKSKHVRAVWEIGAVAFGRVDEWSDVDLVFDVSDESFEEVFALIEVELEKYAPIEHKYGAPNGIAKGAYQNVYKLENISEFLVIELCFIPSSSEHKAIEKEIHGDVIVHFDKEGVLKEEEVDLERFAKKIEARLETMKTLLGMYQFMVKKEINRENPIEAYFYYFSVALAPILELVKMHYTPFRYDFRHRYVYYELPENVVKEIEEFTFVKDLDDLSTKYKKLLVRFKEELDYLNSIDILEHLKKHK